ncbi:MAG: hypothetical protein IT258_15330 [Saprospiraceae bacterium]|nr:hypothetical protein [Saprospiraceae bacterium]
MTEAQKAAAKQAKANGIYFPEKFRKSLPIAALIGVTDYREKHPEGCLQALLAQIFATANPKMPPLYLLELAQHVVEIWLDQEAKQASAIAA